MYAYVSSQAEAKKEEDSKKKYQAEKTENWVVPAIIVKILNKKIGGGKYYKKKGRVERVIDTFIGKFQDAGEIFCYTSLAHCPSPCGGLMYLDVCCFFLSL